MEGIKVEKKGNSLVITCPIPETFEDSKSGKTKIVASTKGNMQTSVLIDGKPLILGLNAYVKK